ncbi:MAG: PD-(D/E)XK nuclease family protein [Patescibacteria group bacterium]
MGASYWQQRNKPYLPGQKEPFKVSRTKIELFTQCPRCFWLDARLKIRRPSTPPFNINKAIDELFKKEFDAYRKKKKPHPLMTKFKVDAIPYAHEQIDKWRENFVGVVHVHEPTNLHVFGAVDDLWVDPDGNVMVVDYKATSKAEPVTALGPAGGWQDMYRRQMEVYQWLLKQNGLSVSDTGYFVYATGLQNRDGFNDQLDFETHVFPHEGDSSWVEPTLVNMKECLESDKMPPVGEAAMGGECDHCAYARSRTELTLEALKEARS